MTSLAAFTSCPIASRFIDTAEDARSYYAHKFVGDHDVTVKGVTIVIRFNHEEIHHFTEKTPCEKANCPTSCEAVSRPRNSERRCFNRERARRMDDILGTLERAAVVHAAKMATGRVVYGPGDAHAQRMAVVMGTGGGVWFVRTAYSVSGKAFAEACRSARPAPWPPK